MGENCIFFLIVYTTTFSQIEDAWVYFKDKPNSETYLNNPLTMLTQRALDRRIAQNIALDFLDVPISESYIEAIALSTGITVKAKSKWLNCLHVRGTIAAINALKAMSFVSGIDFADTNLNSSTNRFGAIKKSELQTRTPDINKIISSEKEAKKSILYDYGNAANQIEMLNGHLLHQLNSA